MDMIDKPPRNPKDQKVKNRGVTWFIWAVVVVIAGNLLILLLVLR
jgi:hypothetical protein